MGIGFVLLTWAVVGVILSVVGAAVLGGATDFLTRGAQRGRKAIITAAGLFPFCCLIWAGTIFVFQAVVSEGFLHRDPGLGDSWYCPLPNGYAILMIDVTDNGAIYNPRTQGSEDSVHDQPDAIFGVRIAQVAGRYILGGASNAIPSSESADETLKHLDDFFLMDTQTGTRHDFSTLDDLRVAALRVGVTTDLRPIASVYSDYRYTWFDTLADLLFIVPIFLGAVVLALWIRRVRSTRATALQPA